MVKLGTQAHEKESVADIRAQELWAAVDNIINAESPMEYEAAIAELSYVREVQKPRWL